MRPTLCGTTQHVSRFTICLWNNLLSDFAQAILQLQNKAMQMEYNCEYIFYDFHHYLEIGIAHFWLDSGVSAFSFRKCRKLLWSVSFSDKI